MTASPAMIEDRTLRQLLSRREWELAGFVAAGNSNKQIAALMNLTEHTVKNYLFRIFNKLGCDSRVTLAVRYVREEVLAA